MKIQYIKSKITFISKNLFNKYLHVILVNHKSVDYTDVKILKLVLSHL